MSYNYRAAVRDINRFDDTDVELLFWAQVNIDGGSDKAFNDSLALLESFRPVAAKAVILSLDEDTP